jgi:sphingomyelin phosphodiesterase
VDNDWKDERLDAFVSTQLHNFDIMCFQEVFDFFNFNRREKLITYARKAGFMYHSVCDPAPLFSSALLDGGILTISRFPILQNSFHSYNIGCLSDTLSHKGVLFTQIELTAKSSVYLFQTHT